MTDSNRGSKAEEAIAKAQRTDGLLAPSETLLLAQLADMLIHQTDHTNDTHDGPNNERKPGSRGS